MRATVLMLALVAFSCAGSQPPPAPEIVKPSPPATSPLGVADGGGKEDSMTPKAEGAATFTFADDRAFLEKHGKVIVLSDDAGARVALSAQYQGRVMTSAASENGRSLGWIHRAFIEAKKTGTPFDNFGGEDRFWLGPEGGQYGLYFPPGKPFTFDEWQTPHAMQEGAWDVADEKRASVTFKKSMTVTNWSGTPLSVDVTRTAELVSRDEAKKLLGLDALASDKELGFVAYQTKNKITNSGKEPWRKDKGLVSIWILAMYAPVPDTRVIVPFQNVAAKPGSPPEPIVNDAYFGKVPPERLQVREKEGHLLFTCDGKQRGKIGLGPRRAKNVLGSYSAEAKLLTIVQYDGPKANAPYVNSMWEKQKAPYAGDVVNSYNDGSPGPGKPPLGGFYEIETSSPGAELAPGQALAHTHRTFHFVGEPSVLEPIVKKVLGVSLVDLRP